MSTIHITFVKLKNVTSPVQLLVQLYADTWLRTPYTVMQFNITIHPPNKITSWMNLGKVKSDKNHQESQWLNITSCLCSMRLHYTEHILLSSCQCWNFILSMEELFHFTSGLCLQFSAAWPAPQFPGQEKTLFSAEKLLKHFLLCRLFSLAVPFDWRKWGSRTGDGNSHAVVLSTPLISSLLIHPSSDNLWQMHRYEENCFSWGGQSFLTC